MGKTRVQTRVTQDTKDRLEEYQEQRDIGQADAMRRLINVGLDREQQTVPDGGEVMDRLDALSQSQQTTQRRQTTALAFALLYVAITVATDITGLGWALAGVVTIATVWATTWTAWGDE